MMHRLLALATILSFGGASQAATISQDFSAFSGPGYVVPASVDRYSGNGKLEAVQINYFAGVFIYGLLAPNDPNAASFDINILGTVGISFLSRFDKKSFSSIVTLPSTEYDSTPTYANNFYYEANALDTGIFVGIEPFMIFSEGNMSATSPSGTYTVLSETPNTFAYGNVIYTYSTVPEPSTWAMMIAGIGLVGYAMRRRQLLFAH